MKGWLQEGSRLLCGSHLQYKTASFLEEGTPEAQSNVCECLVERKPSYHFKVILSGCCCPAMPQIRAWYRVERNAFCIGHNGDESKGKSSFRPVSFAVPTKRGM